MVGLDGMPFQLIRDLSADNTMPNTGRLIEEGVFRQMASSIPEISSVAWSSIITGANPGEHGIFGFTDLATNTYRLTFPNFNSLKMPPFWERENSGRSVILNVPSTFPARPLNGVQVSGFVALDLERSTYPPALVPWLESLDYRVDVDSQAGHQSLDLFLRNLDRTLQARIAAYRHLWHGEDWDTFVLVFTGTDRLAHFLWDAYEDKSHKYHSTFLDYLHQIDEVIGEITHKMNTTDSLIMLSDHGFELLECDVHINFFLSQQEFLKFKKNPPQSLADIDYGTKAFALDPARIYINLEGKYPRGSVKPEDKELVIDELEKSFESLKVNGRKVIEQIYRKEETYEGPYLDQAPDLVLLPGKGFNFKASLKAGSLFEKGILSGKHTQKDAFLLVSDSSEDIVLNRPSVADVVGIMSRLREKHGNR